MTAANHFRHLLRFLGRRIDPLKAIHKFQQLCNEKLVTKTGNRNSVPCIQG